MAWNSEDYLDLVHMWEKCPDFDKVLDADETSEGCKQEKYHIVGVSSDLVEGKQEIKALATGVSSNVADGIVEEEEKQAVVDEVSLEKRGSLVEEAPAVHVALDASSADEKEEVAANDDSVREGESVGKDEFLVEKGVRQLITSITALHIALDAPSINEKKEVASNDDSVWEGESVGKDESFVEKGVCQLITSIAADDLVEEEEKKVVVDGVSLVKNDSLVQEAPAKPVALDDPSIDVKDEEVAVNDDSVRQGESIRKDEFFEDTGVCQLITPTPTVSGKRPRGRPPKPECDDNRKSATKKHKVVDPGSTILRRSPRFSSPANP